MGIQYFLLRQNIGLINWFGNLSLLENATEKYQVLVRRGTYWKDLRSDPTPENGVLKNDLYHGGSYFKNDPEKNKILRITWKANKIIVDIDQSTPDILIINQNYDKDWTTNTGEMENINGLLGVKMNGPVARKIILTYFPSSLRYGAGLSFITLILCLILLIKERLALQKKTGS